MHPLPHLIESADKAYRQRFKLFWRSVNAVVPKPHEHKPGLSVEDDTLRVQLILSQCRTQLTATSPA